MMSALASEFALFDRLHAAHPGPTWPNRLFQLMGTSKGCTETSVWDPDTFLFTGKTVFDTVRRYTARGRLGARLSLPRIKKNRADLPPPDSCKLICPG